MAFESFPLPSSLLPKTSDQKANSIWKHKTFKPLSLVNLLLKQKKETADGCST